ncbi:MAG: hypothetical protein ACRC10_01290 [Thermoguttaceae bacterium]
MSVNGSGKNVQLGFMTVIEHPRFGMVGGFLVLTLVGRPVEFHCTAPVRPNRAQEILYGNTLKPYLYGEQIAQVLLRRAKSDLALVLTDQPAVLAVQDSSDIPVLYVAPWEEVKVEEISNEKPQVLMLEQQPQRNDLLETTVDETETSTIPFAIPAPSQSSTSSSHSHSSHPRRRFTPLSSMPGLSVLRWKEQQIADSSIWIPNDRASSLSEIAGQLNDWAKSIDYSEPFQRIRLALEEAQKAA